MLYLQGLSRRRPSCLNEGCRNSPEITDVIILIKVIKFNNNKIFSVKIDAQAIKKHFRWLPIPQQKAIGLYEGTMWQILRVPLFDFYAGSSQSSIRKKATFFVAFSTHPLLWQIAKTLNFKLTHYVQLKTS